MFTQSLRFGACAALVVIASLSSAVAQGISGGTSVAIVDMQRVLRESKAGIDIRQQTSEVQTMLQEDALQFQADLRAEEQEITAARESINAIEFEARVKAFEAKLGGIRERVNKRKQALELATQEALGALASSAEEALMQVSTSLGVDLVLDRSVVLIHSVPDITDRIRSALDGIVTEVPLNYSDYANE